MTTTIRPMGLADWGRLILLACLWGSSYPFITVAVTELPPLTVVWGRVAFAGIAVAIYLRAVGLAMPREPTVWLGFLGLSVINNALPFALVVWAQNYIQGGLAAILTATMPLFTILMAHGMTHDERLSGAKLAGIALGLLGVAILIGIDALDGFGINIVAEFAVLGASASYSLGLIYGRKFSYLPSPVVGMGQLCGSTLTITLLVLLFEPPWRQTLPSWQVLGAVLGLAVLGTAMAYTVFFKILATSGATATSLVSFLTPVAALLLSFIFLGEEVAANHLAGMVLIFAGLAVIDGRMLRVLRRANA